MNKLLLKTYTVISALLISLYSLAQDEKKVDININTNEDAGQWYMQPWAWVVGGAIFILLLVALLRGGKKG